MFWKRKPKPPPPPADPELAALQAALATRQETLATLELDLLNSRLELAAFNAEIERRVGPLQRQIEALEAALAEARRMGARRMMYGDRANSADLPDDVLTQYRRTWGVGPQPEPPPQPPPPPKPPRPPDANTEAELKRLYRVLAKRFHPDLATDPAEKDWRATRMAEVNAAYAARDLAALRRLEAQPDYAPPAPPAAPANAVPSAPPPPPPPTRDEVLAGLRAEIERLTALTARREQELDALAASPAVQLKLEATFARRAGRDLLGEMSTDLQAEVRRLEGELAVLG